MNVDYKCKLWGWTLLRFEKTTLSSGSVVNVFWGVKVLWFKIWVCNVAVHP